MAMTDRDRKKLWGQAAGTCSLCRKFLIQDAEHPAGREALIGEEAHIISESRNGPRGLNSVPGMDFDTCHNRILLCRIHHRIIDEQPHQYSVDDLREIKAQHERWVRDRLHDLPEELDSAPIGLKARYPSRGMLLPRLRSGKDAWLAAIGSAFYLLEPVDEDEASAEACDAADRS